MKRFGQYKEGSAHERNTRKINMTINMCIPRRMVQVDERKIKINKNNLFKKIIFYKFPEWAN